MRERPRLPELRLQQEAEKMRLEIDRLMTDHERAKIVTPGLQSRFWLEILEPLLRKQITDFGESAMTMRPEDFASRQAAARTIDQVIAYIEGLDGKEMELKLEAEELLQKLTTAEDSGLIPATPPDDRREQHG